MAKIILFNKKEFFSSKENAVFFVKPHNKRFCFKKY